VLINFSIVAHDNYPHGSFLLWIATFLIESYLFCVLWTGIIDPKG